MTQTQVEYYIKTCETGNIAQAADVLFVSRSAVSRAIADLEREFQAELLTRSKNGVEPTPAGRIVLEMARNFEGSYRGVVNRIREMEVSAYSRRIRVGVTPTNAPRAYQAYLRDYILQYPEKDVIITEACASACSEQVAQGTLDVAFIPSGVGAEDRKTGLFNEIPLYRNRIVLWVRRDSPIARQDSLEIHDILDLPLGYLQAPMPLEKTLESCYEAYGRQPMLTARTSSPAMLRQMVIDGQTCALVTDDLFEPCEEIVAVPLRFFRSCTNYLMWNRNIPTTDAVSHFIAYIGEIKPIER